MHETWLYGSPYGVDGWGWTCDCGMGANGFETMADAESDAEDHEETGR